MKHILSHFKILTAAFLLCAATLPAAEVTVTAPDSPMLRCARGKLETSPQQRGDTLKRVPKPSPEQAINLSVTTFLRGTEWAATGKITQKIPADFPSANKTSVQPFPPVNAK
jgi:hypothetical protein